jgi:hypothetical protein
MAEALHEISKIFCWQYGHEKPRQLPGSIGDYSNFQRTSPGVNLGKFVVMYNRNTKIV